MTTLNVPKIIRKKQGNSKPSADSFRIFGNDLVKRPDYVRPADIPENTIQRYDKTLMLPSWYYNSHYEPERNIRNREKVSVNYLRRNVKTMNDPVCYIPSAQESQHWWPSRVPSLDKPQPPKDSSTTMRHDYKWGTDHEAMGSNRHKYNTSNTNSGIVPINWLGEKHGGQQFYQEKISFEHQYNSRWNQNYPIRSKRHGTFVDQRISAEKASKLMENPETWRADTGIRSDNGPTASSPHQEFTTGIIPGLKDTQKCTELPNAKMRSHFDIAPRSNLNVRIREYVPFTVSSAPSHMQTAP